MEITIRDMEARPPIIPKRLDEKLSSSFSASNWLIILRCCSNLILLAFFASNPAFSKLKRSNAYVYIKDIAMKVANAEEESSRAGTKTKEPWMINSTKVEMWRARMRLCWRCGSFTGLPDDSLAWFWYCASCGRKHLCLCACSWLHSANCYAGSS